MVGPNSTLAFLGILPVRADASPTTGVKEAQAAKKDPKGQAQAVERAEEAHSARDFGSITEVVRTRSHTPDRHFGNNEPGRI